MSIIQDLKNEGVLAIWHHYKRNARDLSGNGNHGVHTNTHFSGSGLYVDPTGRVAVADSPELQLVNGTFIALLSFINPKGTSGRVVSKSDAGGSNFDWFYNQAIFAIGGVTKAFTQFGTHCISINAEHGEVPEAFVDGISIGSMSGPATLVVNDAPLLVGNYYVPTSRWLTGEIKDFLMVNRQLTSPEHAELYAELIDSKRTFNSRPWRRINVGASNQLWQTSGGIYESVKNVTTNCLENSGFIVNSGAHKIVIETIAGNDVPVIECVTAGVVSLPIGVIGQTGAQMAYGTWDVWVNHADASTTDIGIATTSAGISGGYGVTIASDETVKVVEYGVGDVTATGGNLTAGAWTRVGVTRTDPAGLFTLSIDGVDVDTGTDTTVTTASHISLDLDAGDKVGPLVKRINA